MPHMMGQTFTSSRFDSFKNQDENKEAGQRYKKSPRVGAGSLGPNYTQRVQTFLPFLKKAEESIFKKDQIKRKLDNKSLTNQDWQEIGQDKILQTTVLDDIFKKCNGYGGLRPELKELGKRTIDNWDKPSARSKSLIQPIPEGPSDFFDTESTHSKHTDMQKPKNNVDPDL